MGLRITTLFLLGFGPIFAAAAQMIPAGSTVYVAPMHGYEAYIIAALSREHVPVVVILDRYKAQYIIGGVINHKDLKGQSGVVVNNTNAINNNGNTNTGFQQGFEAAQQRAAAMRSLGETSTSISVLDPKTTQIMFSYSSDKMGRAQLQKSAEDFAKHLRKFIEKGK